jgi:hypothetical protein
MRERVGRVAGCGAGEFERRDQEDERRDERASGLQLGSDRTRLEEPHVTRVARIATEHFAKNTTPFRFRISPFDFSATRGLRKLSFWHPPLLQGQIAS